jgi:hypothetical protein
MPAGHTVRPAKWSNVIDLYDDGEYSAIWGIYENASSRCLGVRWNNSYPGQGPNPVWYVEPGFVTSNILSELLRQVKANPTGGNIPNILTALKESMP